ncbi:hypothetical protein MLD38_026170 [Melastoma candidum]|uniref:Uncharacterized protein n=1 Tax=Melastoma candidum TaxID=119954 RepID=A0ACB9NYM9_9MYRT|nr:hypothetical protein MLD38_026170 [Melastoma candidum]
MLIYTQMGRANFLLTERPAQDREIHLCGADPGNAYGFHGGYHPSDGQTVGGLLLLLLLFPVTTLTAGSPLDPGASRATNVGGSATGGAARRSTRSPASSSATSGCAKCLCVPPGYYGIKQPAFATTTGRPSAAAPSAPELPPRTTPPSSLDSLWLSKTLIAICSLPWSESLFPHPTRGFHFCGTVPPDWSVVVENSCRSSGNNSWVLVPFPSLSVCGPEI